MTDTKKREFSTGDSAKALRFSKMLMEKSISFSVDYLENGAVRVVITDDYPWVQPIFRKALAQITGHTRGS